MRQKGDPKIGGRQKGTPNKRTVEVLALLDKMKCSPIELLAQIVNASIKQEIIVRDNEGKPHKVIMPPTLDQRLSAARELAQYVAPKRKAVELTGDGGPLEIVIKTLKGKGQK